MNESEELQRHIGSCNAMRRVTLWCAIMLVTFNFIIILFMTAQTFMIKGRQDRMVSWMDTSDDMRAADLRALADRVYITDKRFEALEDSIKDIRNILVQAIAHYTDEKKTNDSSKNMQRSQ